MERQASMRRASVQQAAARTRSFVSGGQRRHRPDYQIVLFTGLLMLLGLIIMYAIGPQRANVLNRAYGTDFDSTYFVIKQAISLGLAGISFAAMSMISYEWIKKHASKLLLTGIVLCVLLFIGGNLLKIDTIAVNTLGAYRWFNLGSLGTFQPAEVLKFGVLIFLAGFLGVRYKQGKINDTHDTIYPAVGLAAVVLFIIVVVQRDLGTGLSIGSTIFAMFIVSTMKWKWLMRIGIVAVILVLLLTVFVPHRRERLMTFLSGDSGHVSQEALDENYHIRNAMIALGTGGLTGLGIGNSVQATGYLPEAINDSVFAIMGETFGFVGTVVILLLFAALLMRILRTADHLEDMSMRLVVAGVFGWLAAHVVLNISSMLGIFPLTGITLPLLSFGGTSMVFIAGALGLAFQLSRYTAHRSVEIKEEAHESTRSRRGVGGTRYARRRSN